MREGAEVIRLLMNEPEQVGDADGWQLAEKRTVDGLFLARIDQRPAPFFTGAAHLDMVVGPVLDALVDQGKLLFQLLAERRQGLFNRPAQDRCADFTEHGILIPPTLIAD